MMEKKRNAYHYGPLSSLCSPIASKGPAPHPQGQGPKVERGQNHFFLDFSHLVGLEMYLSLVHL